MPIFTELRLQFVNDALKHEQAEELLNEVEKERAKIGAESARAEFDVRMKNFIAAVQDFI